MNFLTRITRIARMKTCECVLGAAHTGPLPPAKRDRCRRSDIWGQ